MVVNKTPYPPQINPAHPPLLDTTTKNNIWNYSSNANVRLASNVTNNLFKHTPSLAISDEH